MSSKRVLVMGIFVCVALAVVAAEAGTAPAADYLWADSVSAERGVLVASNTAQGLEATLGPDGLLVTPANGDWQMRLSLVRSGREGNLVDAAPATPRAEGARAELDRGNIVEWWVNDGLGLEHGFTIRERPEGQGPLVLELQLAGDLLALPEPDGLGVVLLRVGSPMAVLHYGALAVTDAEGEPVPARLAPTTGSGGSLHIVTEDHGVLYPVTVDPLLSTAAWTSADYQYTQSVAWGDWDGDGDLDLAAGNRYGPTRVYDNTGGMLASAWTSVSSAETCRDLQRGVGGLGRRR